MSNTPPTAFYRQKISQLQAEGSRIRKKSRLMVYGKLCFFLLAAYTLYAFYGNYDYVTLGLILIPVAAYLVCFVRDEQFKRQLHSIKRQEEVCNNESAYLQGDLSPFNDGSEYTNMHHAFAYDLDIFGPTSLFQRVNRTITQAGSRLLAQRLSAVPHNEGEIAIRQASIQELSNLPDFCICFQSYGPIPSSLDTLDHWKGEKGEKRFNSKFFPLVYLSIGLTLLSLALIPFTSWAEKLFVLLMMVQLGCAVAIFKTTQHMVTQTDKLRKGFKSYVALLKHIKQQSFQSERLQALHKSLFSETTDCFTAFQKLSQIINRFDQRNGIGFILFNGLFLMDLLTIKQFLQWKDEHAEHLKRWTNSLAEWDVLVSQGTYCFNHPQNTFATLLPTESSFFIEAKGTWHPFLSYDKAVRNDFCIQLSDVCIITGANMAGKSTFLRTMGVNYLLAANGMPVSSESFKFKLVALFSSMRTSDNLAENISYFNAELLRLEQLITYTKQQRHTFIILDEILKGTNSKDKLQGSILFLEKMQTLPVTVIVATHDLELAKLSERYPNFHNYNFEIELTEEIHYTYKIKEGVAQNLNATFLLQNLLKKI